MRKLLSSFTVARIAGPWFSLGLHVHFWPPDKTHIDLHVLWWVFTVGPYVEEIRAMEQMVREVE